jgi:hypothetical protein
VIVKVVNKGTEFQCPFSFAIAPHLGTIQERHAEQYKRQAAFLHHAVDLIEYDIADLDRIQSHLVGRRGAVGGIDIDRLTFLVIDSQTHRIG